MTGSVERVRTLISGGVPDRAPLFDLIRNDAVLGLFAGEKLTLENSERVVFSAYEPAIDATRPSVRLPHREETIVLEDGRTQRHFRWTAWTEHITYGCPEDWLSAKRKILAVDPSHWDEGSEARMLQYLNSISDHRSRLGEVFFVPGGAGVGLMSIINETGLEQFVYYNADYPDVIDALLEHQTAAAQAFVDHIPDGHGIEVVFAGDDIAFNTGPFLSPSWFEEHYFERLSRVIDAYHAKGIKVLFHSDGNLNSVLNGLVAAGIDGLNPIEVLAGMDIRDIHRRYPHLFMAGGIDVSQLLPFGTPGQVRDAVNRAIDDAEGRIMIGSSTELNDEVPLENFLAMREAVLTR
jgi:hypothetical protein